MPDPGAYSPFPLFAASSNADLVHRTSDVLEAMGVGLEQIATVYGSGQFEVSIRHADPIKAADDLLSVRDVTRAIVRRLGLVASFMPKPFESVAGSGLHVDLSLWDRDDPARNAMEPDLSDGHPGGLSAAGRAFLGGLLRHAPALAGLGAPTLNSYKRLLPVSWAPAHAAYALDDRSSFVRIPGSARPRIEGLQECADPGLPVEGDLGRLCGAETAARGIDMLPRNAPAALDACAADPLMREARGPVVFPGGRKVKRSDIVLSDTTVSAWERKAYLWT